MRTVRPVVAGFQPDQISAVAFDHDLPPVKFQLVGHSVSVAHHPLIRAPSHFKTAILNDDNEQLQELVALVEQHVGNNIKLFDAVFQVLFYGHSDTSSISTTPYGDIRYEQKPSKPVTTLDFDLLHDSIILLTALGAFDAAAVLCQELKQEFGIVLLRDYHIKKLFTSKNDLMLCFLLKWTFTFGVWVRPVHKITNGKRIRDAVYNIRGFGLWIEPKLQYIGNSLNFKFTAVTIKITIETAIDEVEEEKKKKKKKKKKKQKAQKKRKQTQRGRRNQNKRLKVVQVSGQEHEVEDLETTDLDALQQQEPWLAAIRLSEEEKAAQLQNILDDKAAKAAAVKANTAEGQHSINASVQEPTVDAEKTPELDKEIPAFKADKGKGRTDNTPVSMINAATQTEPEIIAGINLNFAAIPTPTDRASAEPILSAILNSVKATQAATIALSTASVPSTASIQILDKADAPATISATAPVGTTPASPAPLQPAAKDTARAPTAPPQSPEVAQASLPPHLTASETTPASPNSEPPAIQGLKLKFKNPKPKGKMAGKAGTGLDLGKGGPPHVAPPVEEPVEGKLGRGKRVKKGVERYRG